MARNPHASYEPSDHQRTPIIPIANNVTTTASGYVLDARQGKVLNDKIDQRVGVSGVTGMQIRGSAATNNIGIRVYKNSANTAWTQETISADNATLTVTKREAGESTDTNVATIYSAGDIFKTVGYTYSYTVAANAAISITANDFGMSTPSGYSVVAVRTWDASNSTMNVYRIIPNATGSGNVISMRNTTNSQQTGTFSIVVLYVKTYTL